MFDIIVGVLKYVWDKVKKFIVKIINFAKHIVAFFQDPERLQKLQQDKNKVAVAIKQKLDTGDYNVVNCLFDKSTNTIDEIDETEVNAESLESKKMDKATRTNFGDKDMIVLR